MSLDLFWQELKRLPGPVRLLECGSRRQHPEPSGVLAEALNLRPDTTVVGLDCEAGEGVDVVADLHDLSGKTEGRFDAVLILSVLEHLRRPWVAAEQLARVTRKGGVLFCQTHFLFPRHSWPGDYFRFTKEALSEVFSEDAGWKTLAAGEEYPALVVPLTNAWTHGAKGWNFEPEPGHLNTTICCRRT